MFEHDYHEAMDALTVSEETRAKITDELTARPAPRSRRVLWRVIPLVVAAAIAVVALSLPEKSPKVTPKTAEKKLTALESPQTYDRIFEKIESLQKSARLYGYTTGTNALNAGTAANDTPTVAASESKSGADGSYTKTNTQVDGVDEADYVKTDGNYIYYLKDGTVRVSAVDGDSVRSVATLTVDGFGQEFYLCQNRLAVIYVPATPSGTPKVQTADGAEYITSYSYHNDNTCVDFFDLSDPEAPQKIKTVKQSGFVQDSRVTDGYLYLISTHWLHNTPQRNDAATFVPSVGDESAFEPFPANCVQCFDGDDLSCAYAVAVSYDLETAEIAGKQAILGACETVYCSPKNLLLTRSVARIETEERNGSVMQHYAGNDTVLVRFAIEKGKITPAADGKISGTLLDQYSMDEKDGTFRFVTTVRSNAGSDGAALFVLDGDLKEVGKITDLAPGEQVYSVRFMGDIAYFVTFRQVDPLFSVDLSDPKQPKVLGALKIPGFSNCLFPFGEGRLLGIGMNANEDGGKDCVKLSMFDISDPANVTESDKLPIGGAWHSSALYNHKNALVDPERQLVGLNCYFGKGNRYLLYSAENGFAPVAEFDTETDGQARGIRIGDRFYLLDQDGISVYETGNYGKIGGLRYEKNENDK